MLALMAIRRSVMAEVAGEMPDLFAVCCNRGYVWLIRCAMRTADERAIMLTAVDSMTGDV